MREVGEILEEEGLWIFEQSYMPLMLERNSYDTVCHEHLEYYALKKIQWMTDLVDFKIVDVEFNDINGGSFSVTVCKKQAPYPEFGGLQDALRRERDLGLDTLKPFQEFAGRVNLSRGELRAFVEKALKEGKRIAGLRVSTKGNVLLQDCGIGAREIFAIGEVNSYKFGRFAPGTCIPIVPESELLENEPDYLLVLPWHFRSFFLEKYRLKKAKMLFPLPALEIV